MTAVSDFIALAKTLLGLTCQGCGKSAFVAFVLLL